MSLDDIVLIPLLETRFDKYFSSDDLKKLYKRISKTNRGRFEKYLYDSIQRLGEVADYFQRPFESIKKPYVSDPKFLSMDPEVCLENAVGVYGRKRRSEIIDAFLVQSTFVRRNHQRVLEDKETFARFILGQDFSHRGLVDLILSKPEIAGYSTSRDRAFEELGKESKKDLTITPIEMLGYVRFSPFVTMDGVKYSLSQYRDCIGEENIDLNEFPLHRAMNTQERRRNRVSAASRYSNSYSLKQVA